MITIIYTNGEIEVRPACYWKRDKNGVTWFATANGWEHSFCVRSVK